jgi:hypothetical protein
MAHCESASRFKVGVPEVATAVKISTGSVRSTTAATDAGVVRQTASMGPSHQTM